MSVSPKQTPRRRSAGASRGPSHLVRNKAKSNATAEKQYNEYAATRPPTKRQPKPRTSQNSVATMSSIQKQFKTLNLSNHEVMQSFMGAGSEVSSNEVLLKITKYLDWARGPSDTNNVLNVSYEMKQDLLAPDSGAGVNSDRVLSRVQRCKVHCYPRSNPGEANAVSTFACLSSVPVYGGGGGAPNILSAHQQSVVVPPNYNLNWHKIFDCDYDKLYDSAQVTPLNLINFPLFNTMIVDVDTLQPLKEVPIQLKIEIYVAQTVPVKSNILLGTAYQDTYTMSISNASIQQAFVQPLKMVNRT